MGYQLHVELIGEAVLLTGQGLIGKLVLFVAEKLIGHEIALALDEKKRTCRAFVELYHCLDRLEELNSRFIPLMTDGIEQGGILVGDLLLILPAVDGVSQRFLDVRGELHHALTVLDPTLAESVGQLYAAKGSFLFMVAKALRYEEPAHRNQVVEYMEPDGKILELDMDAYYEWVRSSPKTSNYEVAKLEWPQNLLWYDETEAAFHPASLVLTDPGSLERFRKVLTDHGRVLSEARVRIREFVASKFTVEDILYVSTNMRRDEF